jgi:hypothetical protein
MTAVGYEYGASEAPPPRKSPRGAHVRGLLVLAVMVAALAATVVYVLLVRIG